MSNAEWRMFRAVLNKKDPHFKKYMEQTLRLHRMALPDSYESLGYVEQRTTAEEDDTHYYAICLEGGGDREPIRVNTLEDGMNLLLLLINQRGKG